MGRQGDPVLILLTVGDIGVLLFGSPGFGITGPRCHDGHTDGMRNPDIYLLDWGG